MLTRMAPLRWTPAAGPGTAGNRCTRLTAHELCRNTYNSRELVTAGQVDVFILQSKEIFIESGSTSDYDLAMNDVEKWPSGWLKASLATCVLRTIHLHSGTYGHEVIGLLSDYGLGNIGGGTLYPLLRRLVDDELVETAWVEGEHGPSRKIYRITDAGIAVLKSQTKMWQEFTAVTNQLLDEENH